MIPSFESALINGHLITTGFGDIKNKKHDFRRKGSRIIIAFLLNIVSIIRSSSILYFDQKAIKEKDLESETALEQDVLQLSELSPSDKIVKVFLGDYLSHIGNPGRIIHIWWIIFSISGIFFRIIFLLSEHSGNHVIFTEFEPNNHRNLKLASSNLKQLICRCKVLMIGHKVYISTMTPSVASLHVFAIYYASPVIVANYSAINSILIFAYWSFNFFWLYFWVIDACDTFIITFSTFYLCCEYIKMRYNQLNEISEGPLRAQTLAGSREQLIALINGHNEVTKIVREFNKSIKWILFCIVYIFAIVSYLIS